MRERELPAAFDGAVKLDGVNHPAIPNPADEELGELQFRDTGGQGRHCFSGWLNVVAGPGLDGCGIDALHLHHGEGHGEDNQQKDDHGKFCFHSFESEFVHSFPKQIAETVTEILEILLCALKPGKNGWNHGFHG